MTGWESDKINSFVLHSVLKSYSARAWRLIQFSHFGIPVRPTYIASEQAPPHILKIKRLIGDSQFQLDSILRLCIYINTINSWTSDFYST
jgi:hypothetical protein